MVDKSVIVHDLAMTYAKEKFRAFLQSAPAKSKEFPADVGQLREFYAQAVAAICSGFDEIQSAYLDDQGNPLT